MSLNELFRVGKPRVTETTDHFKCGRGTGGIGTGVYAYEDLKSAKEDYSFKQGLQPIYALENICKNPIEIFNLDDTERLNNAGRAMKCDNIDKAIMELRFINGINRVFKDKHDCRLMFDDNNCLNKLKVKIEDAIEKTDKCNEKYEKDEPYGSVHCVQPINHLLTNLGFDCVLPSDAAGGNMNSLGSVILKETIDKKLNKETLGREDIEDFGIKILG